MDIPAKPTCHRQSAGGDFYVENKCCTACGVPESIAPELIGSTQEKYWHCYWKRQPLNADEVEKAVKILNTQELGCHRYGGTIRQFWCSFRRSAATIHSRR